MKILNKLSLLSLIMILAVTFAVWAISSRIINKTLYRFGDRLIQSELSKARQDILNKLDRSGVTAAAEEAARIQNKLRQNDDMKTAQFYIIEKPDNRIIYHSDFQTGDRSPFNFIDEMVLNKAGSMEYTFNSINYYSAFTTIYPVNWLVVLSIDKDEMLSQKHDFMLALSMILFMILCINALAIRFFGKHLLLKRIWMILDCFKRIERGDLSARISSISLRDEIGLLQEGVNAMNAGIQERARQQQVAEEALRNSRQMLSCVLENFPGVVCWKDRESVYIGCNRNFALSAGLADLLEIAGKTDYDLPWARTEADAYRADDRLVMESGIPKLDIIETQLQADGSVLWFDTNKVPLLDQDGKAIGILSASIDITERKRAEENLKKSAEEIHDLFNRAPCGYHSLDKDGVFIRINDTELQWFGYLREELIGEKIFSDLFTSKSKEKFEEYFPVFKKRGWIRDIEIDVVRKNGTILPVLLNAIAITDADGSYIKSRSTLHDITERKKVEHTLREVQEELVRKEKFAILGQLAGTVAHEIRNPLGVMNNAVYFLKTVLPDVDDIVKEYLDIIRQEIDNSRRIITDLLDFARTRLPHAQPVAIADLINQGIGKCLIPENISVAIDIQETLPRLWVDSAQLEQVFQNLIINAVQAMANGGALNIAARRVHGSRFKVQGYERENNELETLNSQGGIESNSEFVEISIKDTGGGISPENLKKLYQPLFTTKTKGIGLGLVVCKNLVEANNGKITVESVLEKGTTFIIMLPIKGGNE